MWCVLHISVALFPSFCRAMWRVLHISVALFPSFCRAMWRVLHISVALFPSFCRAIWRVLHISVALFPSFCRAIWRVLHISVALFPSFCRALWCVSHISVALFQSFCRAVWCGIYARSCWLYWSGRCQDAKSGQARQKRTCFEQPLHVASMLTVSGASYWKNTLIHRWFNLANAGSALTLSGLNLQLSSSSTTSRELLSQFSTCSGWRWFDVV